MSRKQPNKVEAVTDQHTGLGVLAECRDRRNAALAQCLRDGFAVTKKHRACRQNDRLAAGMIHCVKCATVVLLAFHLDYTRLQTQLAGRIDCRIALFTRDGVEYDPDNIRARERLASDLDAFRSEFELVRKNTG